MVIPTLYRPAVPILENGDRLTRAEFERRYEEMPEVKGAELIEGVVYMPSPVRAGAHSEPHAWVMAWLALYAARRRELQVGDNATVRLDDENEFQPDAFLRRRRGGTSTIVDDYIEGPPELVCEVAASSVSIDLHLKKGVYERAGVQEYLVWRVFDDAIDWFSLEAGRYVALEAGADGVIESRAFSGLRLNVPAMLEGDVATVLGQ